MMLRDTPDLKILKISIRAYNAQEHAVTVICDFLRIVESYSRKRRIRFRLGDGCHVYKAGPLVTSGLSQKEANSQRMFRGGENKFSFQYFLPVMEVFI